MSTRPVTVGRPKATKADLRRLLDGMAECAELFTRMGTDRQLERGLVSFARRQGIHRAVEEGKA